MTEFAKRARIVLPAILALVVFLAARSLAPDGFERLRLATFDAYQRLSARDRGTAPVVVVDVDEDSLRRHGQWPWSRATLAALVGALQDMGAGAIGLDMVFAEPDRTSPARLLPEWAVLYGLSGLSASAALPDHDAMLARSFAKGRVVAGFGLIAAANGRTPSTLPDFALIGAMTGHRLQVYAGAIPNLPILEAAAEGHGSFTVSGGSDEIIRRMPLIMALGDRLVPSLALETLRVFQDESTIKLRVERDGGTVTGYTVRVGDIDLPLDAAGSLWLHHPAPRSVATIPAWQVLDKAAQAGLRPRLKGAAVLVGTSAVGLADLRPTPLSPFEPGVNLHAAVLEQALMGRHLVRSAQAPGLELTLTALIGLATACLAAWLRLRTAALLLGLAGAATVLGAIWAFIGPGWLVDPTLPVGGMVVAFAVASLARYLATERSAIRLRSAFAHYISPDLVEALARDPERLQLGGESREMTFLFTDLEGFTSLTEKADPQALVHLLNAYLDGLCRIAMEHGATVDKIVGDALHAMFNAPLDQPDHAARAVRCALAIDAFAQDFAARQRQAGIAFGVTRIGVNTGVAVVGNFGGSRRFDYTAHGDAINTAARLEAANKTLGTRICVSQATVAQTAGIAFRPIGTLMLKGKSSGVDVSEPLVGTDAASQAAYLDAFAALMRGDEGAGDALLRLSRENPQDPILALHARRITSGERSVRLAA